MKYALTCLAILAAAPTAFAQPVPLPNPSFEEGDGAPSGWTLSGGKGDWLAKDAPDGKRAVAVTGTGDDSNFWRSGTLPMKPGSVYVLRFKARRDGVGGGTPITGPSFCNRDLGKIPAEWADYESVFVTPRDLAPGQSWIKFGQWQLKGSVAFDAVDLVRAMPVCARDADLALGEGEILSGNEYTFEAPFRSASRNHSRPLAGYTCGFNSDRWVLAKGGEVVYRHRIAGRKQTAAEVDVSVTWYAAGELVAQVSRDGKAWQEVGVIGKRAGGSFPVPNDLLPADEVWVRLSARPGGEKKTDGASLQVGSYGYRATLDGEPGTLVGKTHFLAIPRTDPRLEVTIEDIGEGLPGGRNLFSARVNNLTREPVRGGPFVEVKCEEARLSVVFVSL